MRSLFILDRGYVAEAGAAPFNARQGPRLQKSKKTGMPMIKNWPVSLVKYCWAAVKVKQGKQPNARTLYLYTVSPYKVTKTHV